MSSYQEFCMEIKERLQELKDKSVRFIRPVFVDILGRMLDFTVPIEEFEDLIKNGKGFDGSSVEGFARTEESDLRFIPDINTLVILPWKYKGIENSWREAVVFGHITDSSGKEYEGDTRALLKNTVEKYKDIGILKCGAEIEFFIFQNDKSPEHTDEGGYFRSGLYGEIRKEAQLALNEMGIKTEFDHHEVASSQHEIDLTYANALKMADSIILAKYVVKRIARKYGVYASFMPKPIAGINGNGMHLHLSLWKDGKNLFFDEEKQGLSDIAKSYIAGLIKYGKDIQAGLNQWINSYKRLYPGYEAPTYLVWGTKNRSAYIRVPEYQ
ncbi:MAG TPA: glutamine synthetase, partial [Candidatus Pacearchaeota archaeon]|nr:glutamine synthetase [Candidatus Pacearchaeota archaeon]